MRCKQTRQRYPQLSYVPNCNAALAALLSPARLPYRRAPTLYESAFVANRPGSIRYDDMLRTALRQQRATPEMRSLGWQQLADILARRGETAQDGADVDEAYRRLELWRSDVAEVQRERSASMIVAMSLETHVPSKLFAHFATDVPRAAAPILSSAPVDEGALIALMPKLGPVARAHLRGRNDLSPRAKAVLQSFGPSDLSLTSDAAAASSSGITPISELVDRIAHYRRRKYDSRAPSSSPAPARIGQFDYETGRDCVVRWIDAPWRGPVIGLSLSEPAHAEEGGVDAATASAFRRRTPILDARFWVPGETPIAGEWRLSAEPYFDKGDGRFLGYRGTANRPRRDQVPIADPVTAASSRRRHESFRQLVHELKTPLNAIIGFSELIEHQLFGPVAPAYRDRAITIRREGERLLHAVEDVDSGAKLDLSSVPSVAEPFDVKSLLHRTVDDLAPLVEARKIRLAVALSEEEMHAIGDPDMAERAISRLLIALIGVSVEGESLRLVSSQRGDFTIIAVDTPRILSALPQQALANFSFPIEAEWPDAPLLGLEFSLRLVRRMAETLGGGLEHDGRRFVLQLLRQHNRPDALSDNG